MLPGVAQNKQTILNPRRKIQSDDFLLLSEKFARLRTPSQRTQLSKSSGVKLVSSSPDWVSRESRGGSRVRKQRGDTGCGHSGHFFAWREPNLLMVSVGRLRERQVVRIFTALVTREARYLLEIPP